MPPEAAGATVCAFYAARYRHSDREVWQRRLAAGEIHRNGHRLRVDGPLEAGDRLAWRRPPWEEQAVPALWQTLRDDGDLCVIAKPAGLPVLPAGGFLEHTVLRLLERRHRHDPAGVPRPVHRLGRFTSGLLVCARRPSTRAWLSARLRESTDTAVVREGDGAAGCRKVYRALVEPGRLRGGDGRPLAEGESLAITVPIGRRAHPLLGWVWAAADPAAVDPAGAEAAASPLAARSSLTLLERGPGADLVEVAIATGRPHQIRIHCAAIGAPLVGDPLYLPGGGAREGALPGEGGYSLHAFRLVLPRPGDAPLRLEAPPPCAALAGAGPGMGTSRPMAP